MSAVENLQRVGLTEYEARVYLGLLEDPITSATKLSGKTGVPRTKIYVVLESLHKKGWVRIYSGMPLLFRAVAPRDVFSRIKADYEAFLDSVQTTLTSEVNQMTEKFMVKKSDLGLKGLKDEVARAKTVWISNATADFLEKVSDAFREDAVVRILLFPGEKRVDAKNAIFKEAGVKVVCLVKNREVPSISVTLDESRFFTAFEDGSGRYVVDEMLYDECAKCFSDWHHLGWDAAADAR